MTFADADDVTLFSPKFRLILQPQHDVFCFFFFNLLHHRAEIRDSDSRRMFTGDAVSPLSSSCDIKQVKSIFGTTASEVRQSFTVVAHCSCVLETKA